MDNAAYAETELSAAVQTQDPGVGRGSPASLSHCHTCARCKAASPPIATESNQSNFESDEYIKTVFFCVTVALFGLWLVIYVTLSHLRII